MSDDLGRHPSFTRWEDPATGAVSYVLTERLAPVQKGLYYVNPSMVGGWLWFNAVHPPSRKSVLGVVSTDPDGPRPRLLHGMEGRSLVLEGGAAAYVAVRDGIYLLRAEGEACEADEIFRLPEEARRGRHLFRLVTDLTMSADGRHLLLDSHIGNRYLVSLVEVATGRHVPLKWLATDHHHPAFSLHDPELFLINQAPWRDPVTGEKNDMDLRVWLMDTGATRFEPLLPDLWFGHNSSGCHEWWTSDGMVDWCDYEQGIWEADPATRERRLVWPGGFIHGQCDPAKRFYVADRNAYRWNAEHPCSVRFYDSSSGRETAIASDLPEPPFPPGDRRSFHPDPHPHFSADGSHVVYTTTALGRLDVAVAPVAGLRGLLG